MKPSELPKGDNFSGRINKEVKRYLKKIGMTEQKIIDQFIDQNIKVEVEIEEVYKADKKAK